jgi:Zn-dependent protease with chaperone function
LFIRGKWHPANSAARFDARLSALNEQYVLELENGEQRTGLLSHVQVGDRIANIERQITLEDGSLFVTKDNESVDQLFQKASSPSSFLYQLESKMPLVIAALVVTVLLSFSIYRWGIPWAGSAIAHALPDKVSQVIGDRALTFLDDNFFQPSELDEQRKNEIRSRFQNKLAPLVAKELSLPINLHFRNWVMFKEPVANALALPSGDIIVTDRFVELAEHPDQIDAVLLHELGHVAEKHGLEMIVQSALFSAAVVLVFGGLDGGGALADLGVGLGTALVNADYSRKNESLADHFAYRYSFQANIDPIALSTILSRMESDALGETSSDSLPTAEEKSMFDYFASHPSTQERAALAKLYSECFRSGKTYPNCLLP